MSNLSGNLLFEHFDKFQAYSSSVWWSSRKLNPNFFRKVNLQIKWVSFYNLNVFFMTNLICLLLSFMFNFIHSSSTFMVQEAASKKKICNFAKISVFQQGVSNSYWQQLIYSFLSPKRLLKVVKNTLTIGFWRSLFCQNSHVDISPLGRLDWLISMHCSHKMFHFLSASDGTTSVLSDILTYFWKTKNAFERCFWDVSETSF